MSNAVLSLCMLLSIAPQSEELKLSSGNNLGLSPEPFFVVSGRVASVYGWNGEKSTVFNTNDTVAMSANRFRRSSRQQYGIEGQKLIEKVGEYYFSEGRLSYFAPGPIAAPQISGYTYANAGRDELRPAYTPLLLVARYYPTLDGGEYVPLDEIFGFSTTKPRDASSKVHRVANEWGQCVITFNSTGTCFSKIEVRAGPSNWARRGTDLKAHCLSYGLGGTSEPEYRWTCTVESTKEYYGKIIPTHVRINSIFRAANSKSCDISHVIDVESYRPVANDSDWQLTYSPGKGESVGTPDRPGIQHVWDGTKAVPVVPSNLKPLEDVKPFRKREGGWGGVTWIGVGSITLLAVGAAVSAWRRMRS